MYLSPTYIPCDSAQQIIAVRSTCTLINFLIAAAMAVAANVAAAGERQSHRAGWLDKRRRTFQAFRPLQEVLK